MASPDQRVERSTTEITFTYGATRMRNLRLVWTSQFRSPVIRPTLVRNLVLIVAVLVALFLFDPATALAMLVAVAGCTLLGAVLTSLNWSRSRAAGCVLVVRPGGVEYASPTWRSWYPTDRIVRWELAGPTMSIEFRGLGRSTFDARGVPADEAAVATLLAAPPVPDLGVPWRVAAQWRSTAATVRQGVLAHTQLAPNRLRRGAPPVIGIFAVAFAASWVLVVARDAEQIGWWPSITASTSVLVELALRNFVVAAIFVFVMTVFARRSRPGPTVGAETSVLVEPTSVAVFRDGAAPTRVPWSTVERARVNGDWVELVTAHPRVAFAIPGWAFLAGEREPFVERLPLPAHDR